LGKQKNISSDRISKIKKIRNTPLTTSSIIEGILTGDTTALSQAITLVESTQVKHHAMANAIIEACLSRAQQSMRIGITGVPGVGKSTFIEVLGKQLTASGKKVAVLAVDPSSSLSKGSIMGDKTRMQELVQDVNAFIRPSPAGVSLGGVARKTRETIILCEAAGYDTILIETVGVGQSEIAVHSMVDFFVLLKLAGAGDELQGIKRGIMEMADAVVINKADGDNATAAKKATVEFKRALHLYPPKENGWTPKVMACSALKNLGVNAVWKMIETYIADAREQNYFDKKRNDQNRYWLVQTIEERLKESFYQNSKIRKALKKLEAAVIQKEISPFAAAEELIQLQQLELKLKD